MPSKEATEAEIARLQQMLAKRRGKPGFSANVEEIEVRLAELEKARG